MKIVYVINTIKQGGPSYVIQNLINSFLQKNNDITLMTLFKGNDKDLILSLKKRGVYVIECEEESKMKYLLKGHKKFEKIIISGKYDIIHTHGFIPDIVSSKCHFKGKRITTIHNNMFEDYRNVYGFFKSKIYIMMHIVALRNLDSCVCCSKSVYDVMEKYLKNSSYIRNGISTNVDINASINRESLGIKKDDIVYIFVGRLTKKKGILYLISQFLLYHESNEYLLVLGSGQEYNKCLQMADSHIKILGFQKDPVSYMNLSDIYISASDSEGFSISILEALRSGLGLFLSDIPSHKEVFEISKDCYLGEFFSKKTFKEQWFQFRKNRDRIDKNKIKDLQKNTLSDKIMADDYEKIYKK